MNIKLIISSVLSALYELHSNVYKEKTLSYLLMKENTK